MKISIAQLNYTVGDIEGNLQKILSAYQNVSDEDGLLVCTELALTGYYPQDLVTNELVLTKQGTAIDKLLSESKGKECGIVIGYIERNTEGSGKKFFNALALISNGKIAYRYYKKLLPTYNVFDEARHFKAGSKDSVFEYKGTRLGFLICEDAWAKTSTFEYAIDPVDGLKRRELDLVISINASPNNIGKLEERYRVIKNVVQEVNSPVVYANQIGGNDELVFDGASFVFNERSELAVQLDAFNEEVTSFQLDSLKLNGAQPGSSKLKALQIGKNKKEVLLLNQTVLGIRDYIVKCGFSKVVIGSSGGIDSAVTLAICAKALGAKNVTAITMPSKFSSVGSVSDSGILCKNLGVQLLTAPIVEEFEIAVKRFKTMTGESPSGLTKENIQARIRGRILMEYSNHYGALVVSTGNKSEMSVGYATLYGDMNGGVNPLGDLYKMEVYALARYINKTEGKEIIPQAIIDKAPSAELSEDQKDSDSLPEYPLLDAILKLYIEGDLLEKFERARCRQVIEQYGATNKDLTEIHRMVDRAEFKRKQAPPIIRVQKRSFGMGRWLPVAAKYN